MHAVVCIFTYLFCRLSGAKKNWNEGKPNYTCCVHSESNGFSFIKILWDTPSLDGIHSTCDHEKNAISQGTYDLKICNVTFENSPGLLRVHCLMFIIIYDDVGGSTPNQIKTPRSWTDIKLEVIASCDVGLMSLGAVTDFLPCSKMR